MHARMFRWSWVGKTPKRVLPISVERSPSPCVLLEAGGQGSKGGLCGARGTLHLTTHSISQGWQPLLRVSQNKAQEWGAGHRA